MATLHTGEIKAAKKHYQKAIKLAKNVAQFEEIALIDLQEALEKNPTLEGGKEILEWLQQKSEFQKK